MAGVHVHVRVVDPCAPVHCTGLARQVMGHAVPGVQVLLQLQLLCLCGSSLLRTQLLVLLQLLLL